MAVPRTLCALAGVTGAFGAALCLSAIAPLAGVIAASWGALTIVHTLAVAITAALALLVGAAGALLVADWRADVQSSEAWARVNVVAAELSLPAILVTRDDLDPRYMPAVDREALRAIFEAHRFAPQAMMLDSTERGSRNAAAASQVDPTGQAARTARAVARTMPAAATRVVGSRRKAAGAGNAAVRPRLVVNANAWRRWPGAEYILSPTSRQRQTADVIVLGSSQDDKSRPLPEVPAGSNTSNSTEPPSCRGPPPGGHRSCTVATASAKPSPERAPSAGKWPAAAPIVRDDLGEQVPVCAAELDVIETYLDRALRELLTSSTDDSGSEQA